MVQHDYTQWHLPEGATARLGKGEVNDIKFSPDGTLLAVGTSIGVWLYDAETGAEKALLTENSDVNRKPGRCYVYTLAFSFDGNTLAVGVTNGTIELWDIETRSLESTFAGNCTPIKTLMFTEDDTKIACASGWGGTQWGNEGTARLWNLSDGTFEPIVPALEKTGEELRVAFSPDGQFIAVASASRFWGRKNKIPAIQLWDIGTWRQVFRIDNQSQNIQALTFSPDCKTLASAEGSDGVRLWNVEDGTLKSTIRNATFCHVLEFSPYSSHLAMGNPDGVIRLWDTHNDGTSSAIRRILKTVLGHRPTRMFNGHADNSRFKALAFSLNGKTLASANSDGTVRLWETDTGEQQFILTQHTSKISAIVFNGINNTKPLDSDGKTNQNTVTNKTLTSLSLSKHQVYATVWNINTAAEIITDIIDNRDDTSEVALSPDGSLFVTRDIIGNRNNVVRLWDAATKRFLTTLGGQEEGSFQPELAFSPDGKLLAVSSRKDNTIQLWDIPSRRTVCRLEGHTTNVYSVAFSPDNKTIVSSGWTYKDKFTRLWDTMNGEQLAKYEDYGAVAFSPDGNSFAGGSHIFYLNPATGNYDHAIHLEDLSASDAPTVSTFSPDGSILVSGIRGGFIQLRDVSTGKILSTHTGHTGYVSVLRFSGDGTILATAGGDGTILLWDWSKIASRT